MKKILTAIITFNLILATSITFARDDIALNYNLTSSVKNGYVVDSVNTKQIDFSLFEAEESIFCNNEPVTVENNKFSISIEGLTGKQEFVFSNTENETTTYTYYISDDNGYLENYKLEELKNTKTKTYIKTIKGVTVIYTSKDEKSIKTLEEIISTLPDKLLTNLSEIKLLPAKHTSNAAGVTKYNKITLYNLSSYSKSTIKNIVIHEIAHTWAYDLIKDKTIDYSYTNYQKVVDSEKTFPSKYAKENVKNGNYSEDFAESVSFYFINTNSFERKYPARADYIKELLEN